MAFAKRGRPRKERLPERDTGTPELAAKRAFGLTAEPLDLCLERGIITADEHWCGLHLRWLYTLRFGAPVATTLPWLHTHGESAQANDPVWRAAREAEYGEALQALGTCAPPVLSLCVHNEYPDFLRSRKILSNQINDLKYGFHCLTRLWCKRPVNKNSLR